MEHVYSLQGKVALITGAARGIGFGIAQEMIRMGARVVITDLAEESLAKARAELGESCFTYVNNVTKKEKHADLVARVEQEVGPINILVNNAGRHGKKPSLECSDDEFEAILDTNLHSIFSLIKAVLPGMMERGNGSIINISSMSAIFGLPQVSAYSSSKTALLGLTRTLTAEYSGSGVRFNCIAPGFIESKMFRVIMTADPVREQKILDRTPMKRVGTVQEIGYAAVFLASDAAEFITGVCLPVDGGAAIGF
ncbi:SDR family NAD(P)-dependent oxidoreductase [Pontiella sulfatireligans]|uniref:Gluconate 5-dehydrogenase n=1 Tax=Pontiella sulfatireligans TaxID=2750658 RepID=A0A6C2UJL1_9BACT|nr:SDR family NAD(P)-dependent oxidoreductase [Pontiella sulfatireligans]VGO20410.1 Gluconate 5-dehydrogenase [Pontiella sulfatireligans]